MGILNVSELKPAMVVDEDVKTAKGTMLLPKGTELTERHIEIMKTWEITRPRWSVSRKKTSLTEYGMNSTTRWISSCPDDRNIRPGMASLWPHAPTPRQ